jgi:hypothetical protein
MVCLGALLVYIHEKANPSRGGDAKPKGLLRREHEKTAAGLPKGELPCIPSENPDP